MDKLSRLLSIKFVVSEIVSRGSTNPINPNSNNPFISLFPNRRSDLIHEYNIGPRRKSARGKCTIVNITIPGLSLASRLLQAQYITLDSIQILFLNSKSRIQIPVWPVQDGPIKFSTDPKGYLLYEDKRIVEPRDN